MIKEYRKVATIKAEQFDGSDEMIKKYHIRKTGSVYMNKGAMYKLYENHGEFGKFDDLYFNDWIVISFNGEFYPIKDDIFKKTYQEIK